MAEKMAEKKETRGESKSSSGMDPKLAALLCWIFAPVSSIVFMLLDEMKEDEFIQFNAKESLWYSVAHILIIPLGIVFAFIPFINVIAGCVLMVTHIVIVVGRLVIAVKAYNGEKVVLPVIGDMASK